MILNLKKIYLKDYRVIIVPYFEWNSLVND